MIDTLLFDLDNTLLDFDKAEANALSKALHDVNIKVDDLMLIRYNKINSSQWKLLEKGIITREEIKLRRFKILFEEFSLNADPKEVARNYQEYLGQGHYFIKDAEEVLEQLSKTHRIYLVTNGTLSVQKEELKVPGSKNIYKAFLSPKKLDTINQARNILNIVSHTFQILKKKTLQLSEIA